MKCLHIGVWFGICFPFLCRLDREEDLGAECLRERFYRLLKNNILQNARLLRYLSYMTDMEIIYYLLNGDLLCLDRSSHANIHVQNWLYVQR
jgi:hypothetical protein